MSRISIELPSKFLFTAEIHVRVTDLNYGGHVGNDTILTLMQEARVQFYRKMGFKNELNFEGDVGQIITDAAVLYKSESFLGDVLLFHIAAADFNKYGFDLLYWITNKETGKEVARAKTNIVCFDYEKRKVAPIPEKLFDSLQ